MLIPNPRPPLSDLPVPRQSRAWLPKATEIEIWLRDVLRPRLVQDPRSTRPTRSTDFLLNPLEQLIDTFVDPAGSLLQPARLLSRSRPGTFGGFPLVVLLLRRSVDLAVNVILITMRLALFRLWIVLEVRVPARRSGGLVAARCQIVRIVWLHVL